MKLLLIKLLSFYLCLVSNNLSCWLWSSDQLWSASKNTQTFTTQDFKNKVKAGAKPKLLSKVTSVAFLPQLPDQNAATELEKKTPKEKRGGHGLVADKQIRGLCYWPWDLSNCHSSHSSYIRYSGLCLRLLLPLVNLGKGSNFNFFAARKAFSIYHTHFCFRMEKLKVHSLRTMPLQLRQCHKCVEWEL